MEYGKITLQFLQELVSLTHSDVTVLSFKVAHGAGRGDNYTSMLYRVLVRGERGAVPWQRSLIIKLLPDSQAHRDLYRSDLLFRNEVAFYKEALTALLHFQNSTGMDAPFTAVPCCLLAEQDVVVLEDLQVRGFVMGDRKDGLDLQQCAAVFREIGKFHALSLAMKCQDPSGFQERVASKIQETFFTEQNEDYYREYYSTVTSNALAMVEQGLEESEKAKYLRKFEDFLDEKRFFKTMIKLSRASEPLAVLAHGDCWTNNIMFRYSVDGGIDEVCLVDFQCVRYCSPALDLCNFLYACSSREMRAQHLQELLAEYCSAMSDSLAAMGCDAGPQPYCNPDNLPDMILDEIKAYSQFGLGLALDMIPICTCDSALAPDLYEPRVDEGVVGGLGDHEAVTPFCSQFTPECQRRMTELVRDFVDLGYL